MDTKASYSDPNGCGQNKSCYTGLNEVKGLCTVMGGKYSEVLGFSFCDSAGAENKHIKLPDVTTIFPSITFAAWASIYTGMTPSQTGITGNEFFARDIYAQQCRTADSCWNSLPGMWSLPAGMVTLDAYETIGIRIRKRKATRRR